MTQPPSHTPAHNAENRPMTPFDYQKELDLLSTEIEDAIVIHHTLEEINRLARQDETILAALNREGLFWKTQMHCLQASLFITLGRIFDEKGSHSIHKLVNATLGNLPLFSKEALALRANSQVADNAWVPANSKDLRHLKKGLSPYARRYNEVYRPIRDSVFAHRLMTHTEADAKLFPATNRDEITQMLNFLHNLKLAIWNLFMNGNRPVIETRPFTEYNQRIRHSVQAALNRLR